MNLRWIYVALPAVFVMRIAGFIGDFWVGLGIIALLAFAAVIETFPSEAKKYFRIAFMIWVLLFIALPVLKDRYLGTRPLTKDALERRGNMSDMTTAELMDPVALRAKMGLRDYCIAVEEIQGEWIYREFERLARDLAIEATPGGDLPSPNLERAEKLAIALRTIEKHREECKAFLANNEEPPASPWSSPGIKLGRSAMLGGLFILVLLAAWLGGEKGTVKKVISTGTVLASIAVGAFFLFPSACSKTPKVVEAIDGGMSRGIDRVIEGEKKVGYPEDDPCHKLDCKLVTTSKQSERFSSEGQWTSWFDTRSVSLTEVKPTGGSWYERQHYGSDEVVRLKAGEKRHFSEKKGWGRIVRYRGPSGYAITLKGKQ